MRLAHAGAAAVLAAAAVAHAVSAQDLPFPPRQSEICVDSGGRRIVDKKKLARYLQPFFLEPPPDVDLRGVSGLLELSRIGKRFRGIKGDEIARMVSFLTGSLGDFLDRANEFFPRLISAASPAAFACARSDWMPAPHFAGGKNAAE